MGDRDRKKLEILLGYWIEHDTEHGEEFKEWAVKAKESERVVYGRICWLRPGK